MDQWTAIGREVGAAAGEGLLARVDQIGDLPLGGAVITPAGNLSASFIVHVALQSHEEAVSAGSVRKGLLNGLRHTCRMDIETLALPPLGTGAGNLDAETSADVMFEVIRGHMETEDARIADNSIVRSDLSRLTFGGAVDDGTFSSPRSCAGSSK